MQTDPWTQSGFCHCKTILASHSEILCQSWCSHLLISVLEGRQFETNFKFSSRTNYLNKKCCEVNLLAPPSLLPLLQREKKNKKEKYSHFNKTVRSLCQLETNRKTKARLLWSRTIWIQDNTGLLPKDYLLTKAMQH